jgi:hypothetical protein
VFHVNCGDQPCRTNVRRGTLTPVIHSRGACQLTKDFRELGTASEPRCGTVVDPFLTPEACRAKALDCMIQAETLDDPRQKAAMLQYAEWWRRLADYRSRPAANPEDSEKASGPGD